MAQVLDGDEPGQYDLDLGHGTYVKWQRRGEHERGGLWEYHLCAGGVCKDSDGNPRLCGGTLLFDLPGMAEAFPGRELWQVESLDPLTISPSVLCGCKGCTHHGWIRDGRWQPA